MDQSTPKARPPHVRKKEELQRFVRPAGSRVRYQSKVRRQLVMESWIDSYVGEWDDGAIFALKDEAGKERKVENATIKARILDLAPGMTGKLKGNIKEALK